MITFANVAVKVIKPSWVHNSGSNKILASENPRIEPVTILIGKRLLYNPANSNKTSSPTVNMPNARICFDFEHADERKRKLNPNERKIDVHRAHINIGCSNIQNDLSAFP